MTMSSPFSKLFWVTRFHHFSPHLRYSSLLLLPPLLPRLPPPPLPPFLSFDLCPHLTVLLFLLLIVLLVVVGSWLSLSRCWVNGVFNMANTGKEAYLVFWIISFIPSRQMPRCRTR